MGTGFLHTVKAVNTPGPQHHWQFRLPLCYPQPDIGGTRHNGGIGRFGIKLGKVRSGCRCHKPAMSIRQHHRVFMGNIFHQLRLTLAPRSLEGRWHTALAQRAGGIGYRAITRTTAQIAS